MKILHILLFASAIILSSCGSGDSSSKETSDDKTESKADTDDKELTKAKDCNEFIDQYEEWMDDYLVLLEKYMANPMDQSLMEEYMKLGQESTTWMTQWSTGLAFCAANEKYEKRFEEITTKAEEKLKELGIE